MGVHMLIIGVAMCLCHYYGIVCNWILMREGLENILLVVTHVLSIFEH